MAANCGPDAIAKVEEEGEVVVGEKTNTNASKTAGQKDEGFNIGGFKFITDSKPSENTATTTETMQLKEWQIAYNCVAMRAPAIKQKKNISRK